jgi:hypothetical protein
MSRLLKGLYDAASGRVGSGARDAVATPRRITSALVDRSSRGQKVMRVDSTGEQLSDHL